MEAVSQRHAAPQPSTAAAKRCVCIINPAGANGKLGRLWTKLSADVREQLKGFNLQECLTTGPGTASSLARKAAAAGADVVLAVGGDGTIHEVVSGLVQQQQQQQPGQQQRPVTALAVLPLGTGSDYARTFGWRLNDVAAACQRILSGQEQLTDVSVLRPQSRTAAAAAGVADAAAAAGDNDAGGSQVQQCSYVINEASCAVGALSAARAGRLKQLGALCYPLAGALTLMKWKGCTVQVCMDDSNEWQTLEGLTTLVLGHGQFWGGGLQILPGADPTDGLMDVVALQGLGLWDFISKGHLLRTGQHVHVKGVNVLGKCRRLAIRAPWEQGGLAWECDGEPQVAFEAVEVEVLPGALRLLSSRPAAIVAPASAR